MVKCNCSASAWSSSVLWKWIRHGGESDLSLDLHIFRPSGFSVSSLFLFSQLDLPSDTVSVPSISISPISPLLLPNTSLSLDSSHAATNVDLRLDNAAAQTASTDPGHARCAHNIPRGKHMYTQEITCWHRAFCQVTAANHRGHVASEWFVKSVAFIFHTENVHPQHKTGYLNTSLLQFYIGF